MRVAARFGRMALALALCLTVGILTRASAQDPEPKRIALVIGLSSYSKLAPELQLDSARTDAARVAAALEQAAGFDQEIGRAHV